jgi:hypothetical protein
MKGKCLKCVRFHPKAVGNCKIAQSVRNLEKRYGFNLSVTKCPEFLDPDLVFVEPEPEHPMAWTSEDCECEDYTKYGTCECGGD